MKYEVDQSVKIEQTNKDTAISIASKDYSYTVKIDSKIKQSIQKYFNKIKKPKLFAVYLFTSGLIILIRKSKLILNELNKNIDQNLEFRFLSIGKKSPAHDLAYKTFKKKIKPSYIISKIELEKLVFKMKQ